MVFLFIWIFVASMVVTVFTVSDFFAWCWNNHFHISSSLIGSLLAQFCMLLFFIWIIVAGMLLAILQQIFLCMIVKWISFYIKLIDCLIIYLYTYVLCFFNYYSKYIYGSFTKNDQSMCLLIDHFLYLVHWLILHLLSSLLLFFPFELL